MMLRWPRKYCSARVSTPSLASPTRATLGPASRGAFFSADIPATELGYVDSDLRSWGVGSLFNLPTSLEVTPRSKSGHAAAAPPSSVMNSRRLMSDMGAGSPALCQRRTLEGRGAARYQERELREVAEGFLGT
jgi:hypothetical protein